MTRYTPYALILIQLIGSNAFTVQNNAKFPSVTTSTSTLLHAQKQSRSTLIKPPAPLKDAGIKNIQTPSDEGKEEEIYGTKFFGGGAIKEELFDEAVEQQADKLSKLYPKKFQAPTAEPGEEEDPSSYRRFIDEDAFDVPCRSVGQRLQTAINQALYVTEDGEEIITPNQIYSSNVQWKTLFSRAKESKNPLEELTRSLDFYKRLDVAIISAKLDGGSGDAKVEKVQIRWEVSLLWPNTWESRVLLTGTSALTVDMEQGLILSQIDILDGKEGQDVVQAIAPQIQPRFWDLYHIGMTPSSEIMPKLEANLKKGAFSKYSTFEIPPRLVLQPMVDDKGGRLAREAESLPNFSFSSSMITTGPKAARYTTTSPIEVAIRRKDGKSVIEWNIPLPAEFVSYYDELACGDLTGVKDGEACKYSYQPRRVVATLSYGGNAQDKEVSDIRKELYEQVTKDGLKPKLVDGRPQFFFLNNDAKACFTADKGLGMAVYEWRPEFSKSNEVGIELEK